LADKKPAISSLESLEAELACNPGLAEDPRVSEGHCHTAALPVKDSLVAQVVVVGSQDCFEEDSQDCPEADNHLAHLGEDSRPTMMNGQPMDTTRDKCTEHEDKDKDEHILRFQEGFVDIDLEQVQAQLYIVVHMAAANAGVRHRNCLAVDCIHFVPQTAETVVVRTEAVGTLANMVAEVKQKVLEEEEEEPNTDSEKPLRRCKKDVIGMVVEVMTSAGRDKVPTAFGSAGTCASLRSKDGRKKRSNEGR
jgi:hypothetical protein